MALVSERRAQAAQTQSDKVFGGNAKGRSLAVRPDNTTRDDDTLFLGAITSVSREAVQDRDEFNRPINQYFWRLNFVFTGKECKSGEFIPNAIFRMRMAGKDCEFDPERDAFGKLVGVLDAVEALNDLPIGSLIPNEDTIQAEAVKLATARAPKLFDEDGNPMGGVRPQDIDAARLDVIYTYYESLTKYAKIAVVHSTFIDARSPKPVSYFMMTSNAIARAEDIFEMENERAPY